MPGESVCMFSCSSTLADRAGRAPQANGVKPPAASAGSSTSLTGGTESSLDKMLTKGASVVEEGMDGRGRDAGCQDKGSEMHCMGRLHQEWRKELERRKYTWFCEDMG